MFPALLYARARNPRPAFAAGVTTCAAALLLTLASTNWLAPAVARERSIRSHDGYVRASGGRLYIDPIEWNLDRSPESKSWPALVHGALRGPVHRVPGYPQYVAPGDAMLVSRHRIEILNRLSLAALGLLAAILGWLAAARYALTRLSALAWWLSAWVVTVAGESIGTLVPVGAFVTILILLALRRPAALGDAGSSVP
jgi:hypothetical protein